MRNKLIGTLAIAAFLAAGAATANETTAVQGEVIAIQHGVAVQNQGELDQVTIRMRNGETRQLMMGPSDSCPGCVQVGDRVRAQVMAGTGSETARQVRSMKVRRTGETIAVRNEAGELIRSRTRSGAETGSGAAYRRGGGGQAGAGQAGTGGGTRARDGSCGRGRR